MTEAEFRIAYDLIRTLWLRYKAAKNTVDRLYAITQFIDKAEAFLERHGEFK